MYSDEFSLWRASANCISCDAEGNVSPLQPRMKCQNFS